MLPAFGIGLEVIAHFSRKPLFAYKWTAGSFMTIVAMSSIVWAHHLFTSGMAEYLHLPFMILTELIPSPRESCSWLGWARFGRDDCGSTRPCSSAWVFL